ncbi:MAG: hypothetical protein AAGK30_14960, partial [Pseudomonadota bacterium]
MSSKRAVLYVCAFAVAAFSAVAAPVHSKELPLLHVANLCTDPSMDANDIVRQLVADGWSKVLPEESETAGRILGDGSLLLTHIATEPDTLATLREKAFVQSLSRVKRKNTEYFFSATLRSPDAASIANVFWSKQGNRLQCTAATASRDDVETLADRIAAMTNSGRQNNFGPSLHTRAATDKQHPFRVWLSVLKQDTIAMFSADPLVA